MAVKFQYRRDTAANWTAVNPTLADGELGLETDTRKIKIGDGVLDWNSLTYFLNNPSSATLVSTSPYAVLASDDYLYVDASGAPVEVDLPAATGSGRVLTIKKVDATANEVTVKADGAELIDGDGTAVLTIPMTSVSVQDAAPGVWYIN